MSGDMSDLDRFTEFLVHAAASCNAPPPTPREEMWALIQTSIGSDDRDACDVREDGDLAGAAADYHAPPVTPHEDMWNRIDPAWELRRTAPVEAREAGLDELPETPWGDLGDPGRRSMAARWGAVIGIAASLVVGIVLGRTVLVPTESAPIVAAVDTTDESGAQLPSVASTTRASSRWHVAVRLATAKHLGQAETLLTSFRADAGGTGDDLTIATAGWARELLGETRLLLDLPVERASREVELLEELELVLAQIARLGPDAPAFERDIVADGLERQGTIARLRAASPPGVRASIGA